MDWCAAFELAYADLQRTNLHNTLPLVPGEHAAGYPRDLERVVPVSSNFTASHWRLLPACVPFKNISKLSADQNPLQIMCAGNDNIWFAHKTPAKLYVPNEHMASYMIAWALGVSRSVQDAWSSPRFCMPPLVLRLWSGAGTDDHHKREVGKIFVDLDLKVQACPKAVNAQLRSKAAAAPCKLFDNTATRLADEYYVDNFADDELEYIATVGGCAFVDFFMHADGRPLTKDDVLVVVTAPDGADIKSMTKVHTQKDDTLVMQVPERSSITLKLSCWLIFTRRFPTAPDYEDVQMNDCERTALDNECVRLFKHLTGQTRTNAPFTCDRETLSKFNTFLGERLETARSEAAASNSETSTRGRSPSDDVTQRVFAGVASGGMRGAVDDSCTNLRLLFSPKTRECPICAHARDIPDAFDAEGLACFPCVDGHECTGTKKGVKGKRVAKQRRHRIRAAVVPNHKTMHDLTAFLNEMSPAACMLSMALTTMYLRTPLAVKRWNAQTRYWTNPATLAMSSRGLKDVVDAENTAIRDGALQVKRSRDGEPTIDVPQRSRKTIKTNLHVGDDMTCAFIDFFRSGGSANHREIGMYIDARTRSYVRYFSDHQLTPQTSTKMTTGLKVQTVQQLWAHANHALGGKSFAPPTDCEVVALLSKPIHEVSGVHLHGVDLSGDRLSSTQAYDDAYTCPARAIVARVMEKQMDAKPVLELFRCEDTTGRLWLHLQLKSVGEGDDRHLQFCPCLMHARFNGVGEGAKELEQRWKMHGRLQARVMLANGGEIADADWFSHGPYHDSLGNRPFWTVSKQGDGRWSIRRCCWRCKHDGHSYQSKSEDLPSSLCTLLNSLISSDPKA